MLHHYPDKPLLRTVQVLTQLEGKGYLAQPKIDGHRAQIELNHRYIRITSQKGNNLPVSTSILKELTKLAKVVGKPLTLDGEWTGRREANRTETLIIWDVTSFDGCWLGKVPLLERYKKLKSFFTTSKKDGTKLVLVKLCPTVRSNFHKFYQKQTHDPTSEGVVLKALKSTLIGSNCGIAYNPSWFKVKYRG